MLFALIAHASIAAPLALSQAPAGKGGREPAPNVIVTVDDSASMSESISAADKTKKMTLLKNSLRAVFGSGTSNSGIIPDGRIRLAWQAMHNNGKAPDAGSLQASKTNSIASFQGQHRQDFETFVASLTPKSGTPSLEMMRNVFNYASTSGVNSIWANNPGNANTEYLSCRRTYHVFMSDGGWKDQDNATDRVSSKGDSATTTLPDGTSYNTASNTTRVYRDSYGDAQRNSAGTFSDWAFKSWATDLQTNLTNNVKTLIRKEGTERYSTSTCTAANNCFDIPEYWNPRNNPATWQHVSTYTIGFGADAISWPYRKPDGSYSNSTAAADISSRTTPANWSYNNTAGDNYGGDLPRLIQGELVWPDVEASNEDFDDAILSKRTVDLWHGAINSRGKYYPVTTADGLTNAFRDIIDTVVADTESSLVSIATSSSYLRSGLSAYIAGYDPTKYSGALAARPIDAVTGTIQSTATWNAATALDALTSTELSNRFIATYNGSSGISWSSYNTLPTAVQTRLNQNSSGTADSKGSQRFDYIRGVRTNEQANGGTLRNRDSRLGDIVNSNIWYTGKPASGYNFSNYNVFRGTGTNGKGNRTPMLYVGANDGMLHGFEASTGAEKLAYIPYAIATGNLRALTDTGYSHQYYVDGSPFTGDAYLSDGSTSNWKTLLVGTLGAGGKGYFVLDVTDPANFTSSNVSNLVITDTTASNDADMGYITSPPVADSVNANLTQQIVRLNNGRWATILGNGVNSSNEAPVLLIQYLDGDKSIKKLSPCTQPIASNTCTFKGSNGLSSPMPVDLNGDGVVDVVYAGDIQGNMWKFNLGTTDAVNWTTAFSSQPLFVAKRSNVAQPITTAPFWAAHPNGGVMLAFGTGQNLTDADRTNNAVQSYFGIWDNSAFASNTAGGVTITDASTTINTTSSPALTKLQQQTINSTPVADTGGTNYYNSTSNIFTYGTGTGQKMGWYLDWPLSGQRVLTNTRTFSGQKILIQTTIPKAGDISTTETCSGSPRDEHSYQSVLNLFYGTRPDQPPFIYLNSQGNNAVANATMVETGAGDTAFLRTDGNPKLLSSNCAVGSTCAATTFITGKSVGLRASWRQVLQ